MAYEFNEGQGSLFHNQKQNDRQPDYRGTINIGGVLYELSCWNHTSKNGKEYISLNAKKAEPRENREAQVFPKPQPQPIMTSEEMQPTMEDLPF